MSMSEALRGRADTIGLLDGGRDPAPDHKDPTLVEEMAELVRLASMQSQIERQSPTWLAVSAWGASRLLETMVAQERANDVKHVELRARAQVLRELLVMDRQQDVKFADTSPHIP